MKNREWGISKLKNIKLKTNRKSTKSINYGMTVYCFYCLYLCHFSGDKIESEMLCLACEIFQFAFFIKLLILL